MPIDGVVCVLEEIGGGFVGEGVGMGRLGLSWGVHGGL